MSKQYKKHYSNQGFWDKCTHYAKQAGKTALEPALKLYYAAQDSDTPAWATSIIYGALGYFIFPADAIPDAIPVAGYTDDIGVLGLAMTMVALHVKPQHSRQARQTLAEWFG